MCAQACAQMMGTFNQVQKGQHAHRRMYMCKKVNAHTGDGGF